MQYSTGMGTTGGTLVNGWKGALLKDWNFSANLNAALRHAVHRHCRRQSSRR